MKIKYLSALPIIAVLVISSFSMAHAQPDVFTQNLYYGFQNNSQVSQLQEFLTSQGLYSGPITGNYYFLTLNAVKAFQSQQGITPAAGYFGPVTMAAANKMADTEVGVSNSQAISETGTSTPSVTPASSTAQLQLQALLEEVVLLEQQLQSQQNSTRALQQIASNTVPEAPISAPTASITANGYPNSLAIPSGTAATISWSSTNANSCTVSLPGWTGTSGNKITGNLTASQTYLLSCSGAGGLTSASVTVNISASPTLSTPPATIGRVDVVSSNEMGNQTAVAGTTNLRIGSYALTASPDEAIKINSLSIEAPFNIATASFQNLKVVVGGTQFGTVQTVVNPNTQYTFSDSPFEIPPGSTVIADVYADTLSSAPTGTRIHSALTGVTGKGVVSNGAISLTVSPITSVPTYGQGITFTSSLSDPPYFVAKIPSEAGFYAPDIARLTITTELSDGTILPNKQVQINGVNATSGNDGLVPYIINGPAGGACREAMQQPFTVTVTDGTKSYTQSVIVQILNDPLNEVPMPSCSFPIVFTATTTPIQ
jgi:hypothetical protein